MPSLLVTPRGEPAPPGDVLAALASVGDEFSIKWLPTGQGCWAVMAAWPPTDQRRSMVRSGEIREEDARDVVCYLPKDCSLAEARDYFEKEAFRGSGPPTHAEILKKLAAIRAHNERQEQQVTAQAMAYAEEIAPVFAPAIAEETGHKVIRVAQRSGHKPKHVLPPDRAPGEL